jgi:hypothetical protein
MNTHLPKDDLPNRAQLLIPGAYDRTNLTHRQPGSMGGGAFGSGTPSGGPSSMDAATIADRQREGGGGLAGRAWWLRWWSPAR